MSRIGKMPIDIPKDAKVELVNGLVKVSGPKGALEQKVAGPIEVEFKDEQIHVKRLDNTRDSNAFQGLYRALIQNMFIGVTTGFKKVLLITGVGYRADMQGKELLLNLGYSHQIKYPLPPNITIDVEERQTKMIINGIDKQVVGQVAAKIRSFRPPDPYKAKGIKYEGERISLKAGKAGKKQ